MPHAPIQTTAAPTPVGPYSQAVVAGDAVYVSGQGPIDPATGRLALGTFEEQAALTFSNLRAILEAAGCALSDVVKVTVYLADLSDFAALNEVYRRVFRPPYPARATVGAHLLFHTAIEVECVAVRTP